MIRDVERWRAFEHRLASAEPPDFAANLRVLDGMYEYANKLGKFTAENALDGIEKTIHLAAVLHGV